MGLFDAFKKKAAVKAEEVNPLHGYLTEANLGIENLQVVDANGTVTVTGTAQDGETAAKVAELLTARGVASVTNNVAIADLSHLGIQYRVATNSSNLNCRKGPSKDDKIVGKFPKDAVVNLIKRHNATWHLVKAEEVQGFCHTDYLEQVKNT